MNVGQLLSDVYFLCGATSASYPTTDLVRNMNIAYDDVARVIWESDGVWSFDDNNNTDRPIAYRSLANASATYTIPTTAIRIEQIEVKDGEGNWTKLKPITYKDINTLSPEEYLTGGGLPYYYLLEGTQITLYPAPATNYVTMSSGMAVRLNRNVTELVATATTTSPGFARPFHRILSYAAAVDFEQDPNKRQHLSVRKSMLEEGLKRFYSSRSAELQNRIIPASKRRWRNYR
jgi:hypothetical protein